MEDFLINVIGENWFLLKKGICLDWYMNGMYGLGFWVCLFGKFFKRLFKILKWNNKKLSLFFLWLIYFLKFK